MMRYHGKPSFFLTFSAAEHHWTDLLKNLGRIVDKKEYTDKEIFEMSKEEKQRLILADPITCARHFNYRTHIFSIPQILPLILKNFFIVWNFKIGVLLTCIVSFG